MEAISAVSLILGIDCFAMGETAGADNAANCSDDHESALRRIYGRSYAILGISLSHWNPFGGLS